MKSVRLTRTQVNICIKALNHLSTELSNLVNAKEYRKQYPELTRFKKKELKSATKTIKHLYESKTVKTSKNRDAISVVIATRPN